MIRQISEEHKKRVHLVIDYSQNKKQRLMVKAGKIELYFPWLK